MKLLLILILLITVLRNSVLATDKDIVETVILVPGLGDRDDLWLIKSWWKQKGIRLITFETKWKSDERYEDKIKRLVMLIDDESRDRPVSLVGTSAGGSLVINAYSERKDRVKKAITICARLRTGNKNGFRGFMARTKGYPAFAESITRVEEVEKLLSKDEKKRIMTIRAMFGDELVPSETAIIDQAINLTVPTMEHNVSIMASLTIFSEKLTKFVRED